MWLYFCWDQHYSAGAQIFPNGFVFVEKIVSRLYEQVTSIEKKVYFNNSLNYIQNSVILNPHFLKKSQQTYPK